VTGQYFATRPNLKRLYIASGAVVYSDRALQTRYREWQGAAGISYRYNDFFVPYIALKYASCHWKLANGANVTIEDNTGTFLYNLKNHRFWGYVNGQVRF
jgi:hypothetical protein